MVFNIDNKVGEKFKNEFRMIGMIEANEIKECKTNERLETG